MVFFWKEIEKELSLGNTVCLMCVVESSGSSPGRQGFKQFVSSSGIMHGSIGGGIMEKKLVDFARERLAENQITPIIKRQIHRTNIERDKSGMICSGEQTIAFYFLQNNQRVVVLQILESLNVHKGGALVLDQNDFSFVIESEQKEIFQFHFPDESHWTYCELLNRKPVVIILGGGHVGLAVSRLMHQLDFMVKVFDDRAELNTVEQNAFAEITIVDSYDVIAEMIDEGMSTFVVVATTGYRSDKVVLQQLLGRNFAYLGMLGSKEKVKKLFDELMREGFSASELARIYAPIGISISSKTPSEIAISIAAQIIKIRNENA